MNFIFQKRENGIVSNPTLLFPNMTYNPNLNIPLREQKATDLIDFVFSVGTEEMRRAQNNQERVVKVIDTVFNAYNEPDVIDLVKSYMKRGRLNMQAEGDSVKKPISRTIKFLTPILSMHNKQRMKADAPTSAMLRGLIIDRCEKYKSTHAV